VSESRYQVLGSGLAGSEAPYYVFDTQGPAPGRESKRDRRVLLPGFLKLDEAQDKARRCFRRTTRTRAI
jgi:hypothetical protein